MGVKLGLTLRVEHRLRMLESRVFEENIWTKEGSSDRKLKKTAYRGAS
jgi:hypothetical protein